MRSLAALKAPSLSIRVASSPIHGRGIFAAKGLPKGKIFLALKKVADTGDEDKDWERTLVGRFTNHADSPNMDVRRMEDAVFYVTKKPLRGGTELTVSYGAVEMSMEGVYGDLADLAAAPPARRRLFRFALGVVVRFLKREGFDVSISRELWPLALQIHVRSKREAAATVVKLTRLYGLEVKKRLRDGTVVLALPNSIIVTVWTRRKPRGFSPRG